MTDEQLAALRDPDQWQTVFSPAEIVLLDLCDRLIVNSDDLGPELIARLREAYNDEQIAEILLVAGQANMNNRAGEAAKQLFRDR